jgi:hypothetical protein
MQFQIEEYLTLALQYSTALRNAQLDAINTVVDVTVTLEIRTLAPPANCAAADVGAVLATVTLPDDWLAAASGGVVAKTGTAWTDASADATGIAGHFRIKKATTCHLQGTVGTSGTDMVVDNTNFASGQSFSVTSFQITAGNA